MKRFHARHCRVEYITIDEANAFLEENHRQSSAKTQLKIKSFGLFSSKNELLGVVQFCAPRTSAMAKIYSVELLRLAFKKDIRVSGGASKLVKHYVKRYRPADIFTYQDATGENTDVYAHCGFTFVSQAKKKEYLVAPGKTLDTASRKEALGMAYATRYGPDRITGSKLGEVYREDGTRKSNKEIFIEDLGWHVEETPGDRVWEWVDPNRTYYVYKITATDSDKYYIGVKGLYKKDAAEQECLNDNYYGSGGDGPSNKFRNWKKKHHSKIEKEILFVSNRKGVAYEKERNLIGDSWQTDPLCLNSTAGGRGTPPNEINGYRIAVCAVHGEGHFIGVHCRRCLLHKQSSTEECITHGTVSHFAGHCRKCLLEKALSIQFCSIHGEGKFLKGACLKCRAAEQIQDQNCPTHGLTAHMRGTCCLCTSAKAFSTKVCETHGETRFVGDKCSACIHSSAFSIENCPKHGMVKHKGGACYTCSKEKVFSSQECKIHGETKFQGRFCVKCMRSKNTTTENCDKHGEVKFQNGICSKCSSEAQFTTKPCRIHGETKHQKDQCVKCRFLMAKHRKHETTQANCILCEESASKI